MAYRYWSPFAEQLVWQHQLRVMQGNLGILTGWLLPADAWLTSEEQPTWQRWLGTFDFLGLAMIALWIGMIVTLRGLGRLRRQRWCWAMVPVAALAALYLPFFVMAEDSRYFYAVWTCLWVLALNCNPSMGGWRRAGFHVMVCSFAIPAVLWCGAALRGLPNPAAQTARELAAVLREEGVTGPFAGSATLPGGRTGLYTAFLMGGRWLGDNAQGRPAEFAAAGARAIVVRRSSSQAGAFANDPRWRAIELGESTPVLIFLRHNP